MERDFHQWLIENYPSSDTRVRIGLGDDAAVVEFGAPVAITSDSIADQVHFDSNLHSLAQVGHKAIAVSLSDIAAMGATPVAASIDLFVPKSFDLDQLKRLFTAIAKTAQRYETEIIGGDTNRWAGPLVITSTLYGVSCHSDPFRFWRVDSGSAGDVICVTGKLGGSIAGKHIEFQPRLDIAKELSDCYAINAATDITDSLAVDLLTVAKSSGCGFEIDAEQIPVSEAALQLADQDQQTAMQRALYDGEDFELILCLSESTFEQLQSTDLKNHLFEIGRLTDTNNFQIKQNGQLKDLEIRGYEH